MKKFLTIVLSILLCVGAVGGSFALVKHFDGETNVETPADNSSNENNNDSADESPQQPNDDNNSNVDNEEKQTDTKLFTHKQVGRLLTAIGLEEMTKQLNNVVVESTKSEEKN